VNAFVRMSPQHVRGATEEGTYLTSSAVMG